MGMKKIDIAAIEAARLTVHQKSFQDCRGADHARRCTASSPPEA
jgi:hypothetical protein